MIRYTLRCDRGHDTESWFADGAAFERLRDGRQLSCPACGSHKVERAPMAPAVVTGREAEARASAGRKAAEAVPATAGPLTTPSGRVEEALATLRRQIEENSEYVGVNFAVEARRMHEGGAPERSIHGEAKPEEARRLIEDGIPVAPLPFIPHRRTN